MPKQNETQNTDTMLSEVAHGADNFLRWSQSAMLRGGRITKFKGIAASYSPELGLISVGSGAVADGGRGSTTLSLARRLLRWSAAPVALLAAQTPAFAQDACVEGTPNNFVCEDNGDPATVEQDLSGDGGDVVVTIEDGFAVDTSAGSGDGINISAANSVVITQSSGSSSIIGSGFGIDAYGIYNGIDITTGGDVTGLSNSGIYAGNQSTGDVVIDSTAGSVSGGSDGIYAKNYGADAGNVTITAGNVTGDGRGIYAKVYDSNGSVSVDSTGGDVVGGSTGIRTYNYSTGDTTITAANVTGSTNDGIYAKNYDGAGALTIDSTAGAVTGANSGIYARSEGTGATTVETANVDGEAGDGVRVYIEAPAGEITLDTTAGTVIGGQDGIDIGSFADAADATITTADVTGLSGDGIRVSDNGEDFDGGNIAINSVAGSVTGSSRGIYVDNQGTGALSITTANVSGGDNGIEARSSGATTDFTIDSSAGAVTGGQNGIYARNNGTGDTSITSGAVAGNDADGINVQNAATAGNLTIDSSAGTVFGRYSGIVARNQGNGATTITTADVDTGAGEGGPRDGIIAVNEATSTDLLIDSSAGSVTGQINGIYARNNGTGDTSIITGDVTGSGADGINVENAATAGSLTIDTTAGTVTSQNASGILARQLGSDDLTIITATVSGREAGATGGGYGIFADSDGGSITINSVAGDVSGSDAGIYARVDGGGGISITTANVTGSGPAGISASLLNTDGDLTIDTSAGAVTGADRSIRTANRGTGNTSIITADVTDSGLVGIDAFNAESAGDLIVDTSAGVVNAQRVGVQVSSRGTGIVSVTTGNVTGDDGEEGKGIAVTANTQVSSLSIDTTAGAVIGGDQGISVRSYAAGGTSIVTGDVTALNTGEYGQGVYVNQIGAGEVAIDSSNGNVSGADTGIEVLNYGTGATTITTSDVNGGAGDGIDVRNGFTAGDLTIDSSAGSVTGRQDGITALNSGSGITSVVTGNVTGQTGDGVRVAGNANTSAISVDTSAGAVSGAEYGVNVDNNGYGAATVITGDVVATNRDGIDVSDDGENGAGFDGTDITINSSAGSVTGGDSGIEARNFDTGDLTIITGEVTGLSNEGIRALNNNGTGDLAIDSTAGAVTGQSDGINATNNGTGDTTISTGDVTGVLQYGIVAVNGATANNLTVDSSAGTVTSGDRGIAVFNNGTGAISVTSGDVNAGLGGIHAINRALGTDLTINSSAGSITSYDAGILAVNEGSGEISITTGDINSDSEGIFAENFGTDLTIDTLAGTVLGAEQGIDAINQGSGVLSITTADVTGYGEYGIRAYNYGTDLIIDTTAGTVVGTTDDAIYARNYGSGEVVITTGDLSGDSYGLYAYNDSTGTSVTVDTSAGSVFGNFEGLEINNDGSGSVTLTTANVTGASDEAIEVFNDGTDITLDTSLGTVLGQGSGAFVDQNGTGSTSITTADVTATTEVGLSIEHQGTDLIINTVAGSITAATIGIEVLNDGTGISSITTANVMATSGDGINLRTQLGADDITIDTSAGVIVGGEDGIDVYNGAPNTTTSIITADVTGQAGAGIVFSEYGEGGYGAGDITINSAAGSVTGATNGIEAENRGIGDLAITTADVTGAAGVGISALNVGGAGNLTIDSSAGEVSGAENGIEARNYGAGSTTITAADVTGGNRDGIYAYSGFVAAGLTINTVAGDVSGGGAGIDARNYGEGAVSVTTGDVSGGSGDGVYTFTEFNTGSLTIDTSAGAVTGGDDGIDARNYGAGNTTITAADVTGGNRDGIYAYSGFATSDLTINTVAGDVSGSGFGVDARHYGEGAASIRTGDVSGSSGDGVYVYSAFGSGALTINTSAGAVSGGNDGIEAYHYGDGDLIITTGDVSGSGDDGIRARSYYGDVTISTVAGTVTGDENGISVSQYGEGGGYTVSITTADVSGTNGNGIDVENTYGQGSILVDSSAGTVVGGDEGISTYNRAYGETTTIITGDVTGQTGAGISANDYGEGGYGAGGITINSAAGSVSGATNGIEAQNRATGDLLITTADVTGAAGDGILAESIGETGDLVIDSTAGSVSGGGNGIDARNYGTGASSVVTANVTATNGDGVYMVTDADTTTLDIDTSAGAVVGGNRGIFADHQGSDDLTITVGNVTGQGAEGILASTTQAGADIFVSGREGVASNVVGATNGIGLTTQGADITVTGLDSVTGQAGDALNLVSNGGNIAVSDIGTITGLGGNGIFANADSGNITIDNVGFDGGITATGGIAIAAYADNGGTITIGTSGEVSGVAYGVDGSGSGDIIIDTTNYGVTAAIGIRAVNSGAGITSVTTADVTGTGGEGITASTAGTNLLVNTVAGTVMGVTDGIVASNTGSGATTITAADVTAMTGDGIDAYGSADGITIDSSAGAVTGGQNGINAVSYGSGTLSITTGDVTGEARSGLYAVNDAEDGDLVINTAAGDVSGGIEGIAAFQSGYGTGSLSITAANVTGGQVGINATNYGTDLSIDSTAGAVSGGQDGIFASNVSSSQGNLSIVTGDVTGATGNGIYASESGEGAGSAGADISIDSTLGTVTGGTNGIYARNIDTGDLTITTAAVTGTTSDGINARSYAESGDVVVNTVAGDVSGGRDGINANLLDDAGSLSITTANVDAVRSGISARNYGNDLGIDSSAGAVRGGQDGISASNYSSGQGNLTIITGDVTGTAGNGIDANEYGEGGASGADMSIDSTGGMVTGGTNGILARNGDSGDLAITTAAVSGGSGSGIDAANAAGTGELSIDTAAGSISGVIAGILARNDGAGLTSIVTADVTGTDDDGIAATTTGAGLSIDSSAGTVTGGTDGIGADNDGTGELILTTADIIGTDGDGIAADNAGTNLAIDSTAGAVRGGVDGIDAVNNGSGSLAVSSADVTGGSGAGISAVNNGTTLAIDSSAGAVTGSTFGVFADQRSADELTLLVDEVTGGVGIDTNATSGATIITLGSTAVVTGTSGFGIDARSTGGDITVQGSSGSVTGATDGIYVRPTDGDITISTIDLVQGLAGDGLDLLTQGGAITVSDIGAVIGTGGNGIFASASGGEISVQSAGDITGSLAGIAATTTGAATISLDLGGATTGAQNGIDASTAGGAVTISNSGNLSGGDFAVLASGLDTGPIALNNSGTLSSAIQFAAADDAFANSGTFAASGTSDFGDGTDLLDNTGTIAVTGSAQFDRLETIQSGGILSLTDGAANGTFTTSGDFVGTGGEVVLDVDFANRTVDQLIIGGAATGTSTIVLNTLGTGFVFNEEFLIVQAGAGTEATAFALAEGQQITPFLNADLSFDAAANTFSFAVALNERVFEGTKIAENAQALWYRSTDAWADYRASSRGNAGAGEGSPIWAVAYGSSVKRDENFRDPTGLVLNDTVLDYSQDFFGIQTGVDYALSDALILGVTGGFLNSNASQDVNGNRINFDALNIGLSASYAAGPLFADALIKFDSITGDLSDPVGAGFAGQLDGQSFGLRAQAGYRFGDASFYVEPNVAFDLQKTNLDDLVIEGQVFEFDNVDGARGTAGIRFGGASNAAGGATIGYYLGANMVHEFDGKANVRFLVNGGGIDFQNNPIDTYGNLEAGISVDNGGPLSGFIQVESDLSRDYQSFGGKVGVKVKF